MDPKFPSPREPPVQHRTVLTTSSKETQPMTTTAVPARLFDAAKLARRLDKATLETVPLEELELAPNPRKRINPDGIDFLAELMMRNGQATPAPAWRDPKTGKVILYAGQRRFLAAKRSHELADSDGLENLSPVNGLRCILFAGQRPPSKQEIARLQAMENQGREDLSLADLQDQFEDCWRERAGLTESDRISAVCQDMGIAPKLAHNLRRQITLPDDVRRRVAARRTSGEQISVGLANELAAMNEVAPQLTSAVAARVTSTELHDAAIKDLGAFVHKTAMEDETVYTLRLGEGSLLDATVELAKARTHMPPDRMDEVARLLGCDRDKVASELDALASRVKTRSLLIAVDEHLRDRVTNGRYGFRYDRGEKFAQSVWLTDPVFLIDLVREAAGSDDEQAANDQQERYFGAAKINDEDAKKAAEEDEERRKADRERVRQAFDRNLGLGENINATLLDPSHDQLDAVRRLVCHLLASQYPEVIAYGAGWTNPHRQQPVGETGRHEPRSVPAIVEAELAAALEHRDPLAGITQLLSTFGAAFMLDIDGVPRTKPLGVERMSRKLRDALPSGENPLRSAVWELMRPMLSPRMAQQLHDEFVIDSTDDNSTVDLAAYRADTDLADLDLGEDDTLAQAA